MKAIIIDRKDKRITQPNLLVLTDEAGLLVLGENITQEQYDAIGECIPEEYPAEVYPASMPFGAPKKKKKRLFARFMRGLGRYALPVLVLMLAGIVARMGNDLGLINKGGMIALHVIAWVCYLGAIWGSEE